uniref:Uncharacterized protein n=1 Tax=Nelumbo nucifera TaxID=4432 RepID=A0A822XC97_NELNU|nr:TPA_asm: hypothetical protein HUJ06_019423 [Nelumbo nucifera]
MVVSLAVGRELPIKDRIAATSID